MLLFFAPTSFLQTNAPAPLLLLGSQAWLFRTNRVLPTERRSLPSWRKKWINRGVSAAEQRVNPDAHHSILKLIIVSAFGVSCRFVMEHRSLGAPWLRSIRVRT